MKKFKKFALLAITIDFLALTAWAVYDMGMVAILKAAVSSSGMMLLSVDLLLALGVACWWMWRDARSRGVSAAPYLALTAMTGSAGPLIYLLLRDESPEREGVRIEAPAT